LVYFTPFSAGLSVIKDHLVEFDLFQPYVWVIISYICTNSKGGEAREGCETSISGEWTTRDNLN